MRISPRIPSIAEVWVVNASPLIILDRIGQLDLFARLGNKLLVPGGVLAEISLRCPQQVVGTHSSHGYQLTIDPECQPVPLGNTSFPDSPLFGLHLLHLQRWMPGILDYSLDGRVCLLT